jgi:dTDP-4-dehydrorhamnose reductase
VNYPDPKGRGLLASVANEKVVTGYDRVFWNGLTAKELARMLVEEIIPMKLSNIIHLYGETISKYELLKQAKLVLGFNYQLVKESEVTDTPHESNKTLASMLPELQCKKSFKQMLEEMKSG